MPNGAAAERHGRGSLSLRRNEVLLFELPVEQFTDQWVFRFEQEDTREAPVGGVATHR